MAVYVKKAAMLHLIRTPFNDTIDNAHVIMPPPDTRGW